MSVKMYLSWRTKQRKFSPLGAKHHFLLLFCPPVRLHLHKREMGLYSMYSKQLPGFFYIISKGHFFVVQYFFYFANFCFQESFGKLQRNRIFVVRGKKYALVLRIFFSGNENSCIS